MKGKIRSLLEYYIHSDTIYRLHPPGFFNLACQVFENDGYYYDFDLLVAVYQKLIHIQEPIQSSIFAEQRGQACLRLGDFARKSLHSPAELYRLYHLIRWFGPSSMLELGCALGLSSLCLRLAAPKATLYSVDGNLQFIDIAQRTSAPFIQKPIEWLCRPFDEAILQLDTAKFDTVFLDGDHQYESTVQYLEALLPKLEPRSMVILDDIHWSSDMHTAWKSIRRWPVFSASLESYRWGLLFTDQSLSPVHFNLIPSHYKIWQKFI